jgi:ribonuclease BN (tRNA processing enzyme)
MMENGSHWIKITEVKVAELIILGSGSGIATRDRFSTSIALLAEQNLYLFDCAEPCSALLFRNGIDPLALKTLFISHMHPDHVGGLAPLLFSIYLPGRSSTRKFRPWSINRNDPWYRDALWFPPHQAGKIVAETRSHIRIVLPSEAIAPMKTYLPAVYLAPSLLPFDLELCAVQPGETYRDDSIRVTAAPNTHMSANFAYGKLREEYPHLALESYSYAVEMAGTKFIFSGDITTLDELNPLLQGANILIVEVAHYDPREIGPYTRDLGVNQIILTHIHPGLEENIQGLVKEWNDPRIQIAYDGLRIALPTAESDKP